MRRACTYVLGASSAVALLAFAAPAHAQGAEVNPGSGAPGTAVTVNDGNLCAGTAASATSEAFGTITLTKGTTTMVGSGKVANVPNGAYAVKLTCGNGKSASGTFTVTGSTATATPSPVATATKPAGAVQAGGGGTQSDISAAGLAGGGALLAAGAGLGAYVIRRRTAGRPTA